MSDEPKPHDSDAHDHAAHAADEHVADHAHEAVEAVSDGHPAAETAPAEMGHAAEAVVADGEACAIPEPVHAETEAVAVDDAPEAHHEEPVVAEAAVEPAHDHAHDVVAEPVHEVHAEPAHEAAVEDHPVQDVADGAAHDHAAETHVEAPAHVEPVPEPVHHDSHAAEAVTAAAAVGAAAASHGERRPIWSDQGDAPFDDGHAAPVYDRKARKSRGGSGKSGGSETGELIKTILSALLIAVVLRTLAFQPFTIPSASMEPNLYEGDYIVVSKWSYGYSRHSIPLSPPLFNGRILGSAPHRGDIVVFKLPRDNRTDYIKRVIGLPGDRVQMIANRLYINGQAVDDVVIGQSQIDDMFGPRPVTRVRETLPGGKQITIQDFGPGNDLDDTPVYEVPAGFYFMMGDNRDNSIDSRVDQANGVGLVPEENLVGKAQIILFSWTPGAAFMKPWTWFSHLRPSRFFTILN